MMTKHIQLSFTVLAILSIFVLGVVGNEYKCSEVLFRKSKCDYQECGLMCVLKRQGLSSCTKQGRFFICSCQYQCP
ncbi:unnamed protein product [Arabidopsis halleri]